LALMFFKKKVKVRVSFNGNLTVTECHIAYHTGSHSVTFCPIQVNTPHIYRPVINLATPEGWKAELT